MLLECKLAVIYVVPFHQKLKNVHFKLQSRPSTERPKSYIWSYRSEVEIRTNLRGDISSETQEMYILSLIKVSLFIHLE